jgi:hypothetical protein
MVYTYFPELKDQPKRLQVAELDLRNVQRDLLRHLQDGEQWLQQQQQQQEPLEELEEQQPAAN